MKQLNITGPYAVSESRLMQLVPPPVQSLLRRFSMILVSAVRDKNIHSARFEAARASVSATKRAGLLHVVMLSSDSHRHAAILLEKNGALVITINQETEGGLARPYVIAAQIISMFAPEAIMVKVEPEKALLENFDTVEAIRDAMKRFDVAVGDRSLDTWLSMPTFQVQTEVPLNMVISLILRSSLDYTSGILLLNHEGRRLFMEYAGENKWQYLLWLPFEGNRRGLRIGEFPAHFQYHDSVVREEEGNPTAETKRCGQMDDMSLGAVDLVGGEGNLNSGVRLQLRWLRSLAGRLGASIKQRAMSKV